MICATNASIANEAFISQENPTNLLFIEWKSITALMRTDIATYNNILFPASLYI